MKSTPTIQSQIICIYKYLRNSLLLKIVLAIFITIFVINHLFEQDQIKSFKLYGKVWKVQRHINSAIGLPRYIPENALIIEENSLTKDRSLFLNEKPYGKIYLVFKYSPKKILDSTFTLGADTMYEHPFDTNLVVTCESGKYSKLFWGARNRYTGKLEKIYFMDTSGWEYSDKYELRLTDQSTMLFYNGKDVSKKEWIVSSIDSISQNILISLGIFKK